MKIIQVIPHLGLGGAETMCANLTETLIEQGHHVVVISLYKIETHLAKRLLQKKVKVIFLDKKVGVDVSIPNKLLSVILQEKPDVIHTHLLSLKYTYFAVKKMDQQIPIIHTIHSIATKEAGRIDRTINRWIFKKRYAIPVALSKEIQRTVVDIYGLELQAVPVIFNGIHLSKCKAKQRYNISQQFTIIHVGRFMEVKNHAVLLRAFQQLHYKFPESRLELIGKGELKKDIEVLAVDLGVQGAVSFLGEQTDVYSYLQDADLFVLPSLYEGMPMTIIEAMGTGLPIIASNVGGIPDMIQNEKEGLLCEANVQSVFQSMEQMYLDQELREFCGRSAMKKASDFSAAIMAQKYLQLYQKGYR